MENTWGGETVDPVERTIAGTVNGRFTQLVWRRVMVPDGPTSRGGKNYNILIYYNALKLRYIITL